VATIASTSSGAAGIASTSPIPNGSSTPARTAIVTGGGMRCMSARNAPVTPTSAVAAPAATNAPSADA